LLLNLLLRRGWLDYSKLSVFGKSLFQPEYKILRKGFEEQLPKEVIMGVFENRDEIQCEQISPSVLTEAIAEELAKKEGPSAQRTKTNKPIECNFMNQLMMFQTQKKSPPSIKIS